MKVYRKLALFIGGTLFGSAGFKILNSKDAKAVYTEVAAAGLRIKDSAMDTVTYVREEASDIMAAAREINASRAEAAKPEEIEDTAE